ncbi:DUF550 domain-containing protein [Shimia sp. R9_2]|nr:DUF550 domain-containing protein [Shimia sp. R9_2]
MDFAEYLARQVAVSRCNFGPYERTEGVIDHIKKELKEVQAEDYPEGRMKEWVDVAILALDGLTRSTRSYLDSVAPGATADEVADVAVKQILKKQRGKNELRDWPDWRTADPNKAIEHVRAATQEQSHD